MSEEDTQFLKKGSWSKFFFDDDEEELNEEVEWFFLLCGDVFVDTITNVSPIRCD